MEANYGTTLKIDIDFKPPQSWRLEWIMTRLTLLDILGYTPIDCFEFETTRGLHYYIKIKEHLPPEEINKLQFLLGDDPTRVKINQWRIKRGIKNWNKLYHNVLYRKKDGIIKCPRCQYEFRVME